MIKLLIEKLEPALSKLFKGAKKLSDLQKAKNWKPLNKWLKRYTGDLCKFLGAVSEASVISALLKHIHGLVLYFAALPKSAKFLSKQLIHLWSTHEEESVRVLALMAVRKIIYKELFLSNFVKYRFSKKATKLGTISHMIWRLLSKCQIKWEMVSNFCGLFRMSELWISIFDSFTIDPKW